eukprot:s1053_g24.t1
MRIDIVSCQSSSFNACFCNHAVLWNCLLLYNRRRRRRTLTKEAAKGQCSTLMGKAAWNEELHELACTSEHCYS